MKCLMKFTITNVYTKEHHNSNQQTTGISTNRVTQKIREAKRKCVEEEAIDLCTNCPKDMKSRIKQFLPSKRNHAQNNNNLNLY